MDTQWRAIVTWPRPPDVDAEHLAPLAEALPGFGIVAVDGHHVRAEMTVDGTTLRQAVDAALRLARDAGQAGFRLGAPTQVRVLPVDDFDAEQRRPSAQELIGYSEAAQILEVSPQRARQLALERPDFPPPVAIPAMGPIFTRSSVEAFAKLPRKGGRPPKEAAG